MKHVLCIGIGKMGQLTLDYFKKEKTIEHIYVVDPKFQSLSTKRITYLKNFSQLPASAQIDAAFIMTPVSAHQSCLEQALKAGIQNIFIEKPALQSQAEFQAVLPLIRNQKIAVGYILRQSKALRDLKHFLKQYTHAGFSLTQCNVTYTKPYDFSLNHINAWEECCHPWDLLFCYLNFKQAQKTIIKQKKLVNDLKSGQTVAADIKYELTFNTQKTDLNIFFSYLKPDRKREFVFELKNNQNQFCKMVLSLDVAASTGNVLDKISIYQNNQPVYVAAYPAYEKLAHQIQNVCRYFNTNKKSNLHLFQESIALQNICDDVFGSAKNIEQKNLLPLLQRPNQNNR